MVRAMFVVVSYDIVCDRRRRKVYKILEGYGVRQQYSLFECDLGEEVIAELVRKISFEVDTDEDSVRIYRFCRSCMDKVEIQGEGERFKAMEVIVI